jgi:hypothetical protein
MVLGVVDFYSQSIKLMPVEQSTTDWKGLNIMRNREQWLAAFATAARRPIASSIQGGGDEEAAIRLSCGFPPKVGRKASTAAIVPPTASQDFTAEIFVAPTVDSSSEVAKAILPLLRIAQSGNWRSAAPSVAKPLDTLPVWAESIILTLGEYPHAKIEIAPAIKQTTRLIKVACLNDNYIARVSRSTLENLGAPICPACNQSLVEA